ANTRRARPAAKPKLSPQEIISAAKLAEKTVPICMRGDLVAEVEDLERQMAASQQRNDGRLVGNPEARQLAEQIEALRETMQESTIVFRLRAMHRRDWPELVAKHPPRKDDVHDKALGINRATFFDEAIPKSIIEPELDAATVAE